MFGGDARVLDDRAKNVAVQAMTVPQPTHIGMVIQQEFET
jgi:hypothetical protein